MRVEASYWKLGIFGTLRLQLLRRIKSDISLVRIEQYLDVLLIYVTTFGLPIRAVLPAKADTFVKVNAKPFERFKNILLGTCTKR